MVNSAVPLSPSMSGAIEADTKSNLDIQLYKYKAISVGPAEIQQTHAFL